eukprot:7556304-Alexandrium_andersonii.AAC.1
MAGKKRRATRADELERFQMEEAIRATEGRLVPSAATPPAAGASPPPPASASTSPRTTQSLKEVEEIALILVA